MNKPLSKYLQNINKTAKFGVSAAEVEIKTKMAFRDRYCGRGNMSRKQNSTQCKMWPVHEKKVFFRSIFDLVLSTNSLNLHHLLRKHNFLA